MGIFASFWKSYEVSRTASALYRLSDYQLADIGLRRDQIGEHVRKTHFVS
jgi:uncharacterized protein YjiS (DUF1127 family)